MRISDYIPEPKEIMLGCRPWDATSPNPCPVCKGGIQAGDDSIFCARCDSMSPRREAQIRAAHIGATTRDLTELAEQKAQATLRKKPLLTESERRRIWNGSRGGILAPIEDEALTNRAKIGRDWLRGIDQMPDWNVILDRRGNKVGRWTNPAEDDEPWG